MKPTCGCGCASPAEIGSTRPWFWVEWALEIRCPAGFCRPRTPTVEGRKLGPLEAEKTLNRDSYQLWRAREQSENGLSSRSANGSVGFVVEMPTPSLHDFWSAVCSCCCFPEKARSKSVVTQNDTLQLRSLTRVYVLFEFCLLKCRWSSLESSRLWSLNDALESVDGVVTRIGVLGTFVEDTAELIFFPLYLSSLNFINFNKRWLEPIEFYLRLCLTCRVFHKKFNLLTWDFWKRRKFCDKWCDFLGLFIEMQGFQFEACTTSKSFFCNFFFSGAQFQKVKQAQISSEL